MNTPSVKFRRAKETSFLICDEIIFDLFSPYALKVYGQLRKLVSYNKESDETEVTVKILAHLSGISERKTFDILNELEHTHHIIQRTNLYHFRRGQVNTFLVGQTYGMFKTVQTENTTAPNAEVVDNPVQKLPTPAPYAVPPAQYAEVTAPNADLYKQESSQEVFKKKQKQGTVNPSVFSDTDTVKTHLLEVIAKRGVYVDEEIIDQGIYYSFETNNDKRFVTVNKRINIFLKKVREGKWLIPQGFNGITSQSIREEEEEYNRNKQAQYEQDAQAFKAVTEAVNTGNPYISMADRLAAYKESLNANQTGMPEEDLQRSHKVGG